MNGTKRLEPRERADLFRATEWGDARSWSAAICSQAQGVIRELVADVGAMDDPSTREVQNACLRARSDWAEFCRYAVLPPKSMDVIDLVMKETAPELVVLLRECGMRFRFQDEEN